ncbi:amidohydrolase [Pusillimonas sp. ANT_WB101]|uniref:amidohydrolase n=1 Tax=Pusillimonas sp. ANT_WB101 TaxID=2597356 RepID=UPI0011EC34DF|nr:amidohydrolase [Pusillimonas sp. ANT_WB101]KAA0889410.1 amidohydrolase family protein [Pusillimonas sp. ANT_WB101]
MKLITACRLATLLGVFSLAHAASAAPIADQIWSGGPILTMDDTQPRVEAVAVQGKNILALGSMQDVEQYKGPETQLRDLAGRTLLPGFVDAHGHAFMIGLQAISANLLSAPDGKVNDMASLKATLKAWSDEHAAVQEQVGMILGFGYDNAQLAEQQHPTREDLDAVSTDVPVLIIHQSGHIGVMNSKALEAAGFTEHTPNPEGGIIRRLQGSQQPNGVLEEAAFFTALAKQFGHMTESQAEGLFEAGSKLLSQYGYTTGQEGRATSTIVPFMKSAAAAGRIPIDVVAYVDVMQDRDFIAKNASQTYVDGFRVGGAKLTIDGSPQGFTAYRDRPYYAPPEGYRADYHGYTAVTPDQVFDAIDWAFENNTQIITHANGEAASDLLLAAIKTAKASHPPKDRRAVLIHGQFLRKDQVATMDELDVFPSLFPMHTFYWGDWHRDRTVGPEDADNISPTGWVRERGMKFSSHHDAPVAFPDSMRVLSATVTRRTRSGDILGPHQRVDVNTALKAMTIWPAYQHFEEGQKGSLAPSKLADFVILSEDPTAIDPEALHQVEVTETVKGGKTIYRQGDENGEASPASTAAAGDVLGRVLSNWQRSDERNGVEGHRHGPDLLMPAMLQGLKSAQSDATL